MELFDIIQGNFDPLRIKYLELASPDMEAFKNPALRGQFMRTLELYFEEFRQSVIMGFSSTSIPIETLKNLIDLDETGTPFICEKTREEVRESFKEYLTDEKLIKVFETHSEAAKRLQYFWSALAAAGLDNGLNSQPALAAQLEENLAPECAGMVRLLLMKSFEIVVEKRSVPSKAYGFKLLSQSGRLKWELHHNLQKKTFGNGHIDFLK